DSKGFLWIATDKGIARYNGIRFEAFTTANGMPDNEIFSFQEDACGRLWLATFNGQLCYYKNGRFYNAKNTPFLRLPFKNTIIKKIIIEADSSVSFLFDSKEKFVNINKEQLEIIYLKDFYDVDNFFMINKTINSGYRLIYSDHIRIIDSAHKLVGETSVAACGTKCDGYEVSSNQDQKYIFNKCCIFDKRMTKISNFTLPVKNQLRSVYFDDNKNVFLNTDKGVIINDTINLLKASKVSSITQDINHNYWISTLKDGLYVLSNNYLKSNQYNSAYKGTIWYAYADNSNVFYTNSDNNFYQLKGKTVNCIFDYSPYKNSEYGNNHGFLILKDSARNEYSYLNFYNNYIFYVTDITNKKVLTVGEKPFNSAEVVKQVIDVNDHIFLRTIKRIFSIKRSHFLTGINDLNVKNILHADNSDRIYAFARSPENQVWYSTINGVYTLVDGLDSIQKQFNDVTFNKFEFLQRYLIGYTLDGNSLMICSNINGNIVIDSSVKQNCIWDKFYKLDSTHMLISTNDYFRLFSINPSGSRVPYTITAIENPFIPLRAETICNDKNFCYFFANGNILKLGIEDLFQKPAAPRLYFNFINYGGTRYPMKGELKIPFKNHKNITITFSTVSFASKSVFYQYSASKEKDNWVALNGEEINIADPGYGNYTIKVRAKTISSEYCEPIEFVVQIAPPFWATWWFNTLCILFTTSLVILGVRYRILWVLKKNQKENETKIRFMKSEYKALNALMNPHFIFNTLNNVQSLVNRNDKLAANEYLRIFADLVRQNMHNVSKEMIPLQKELDLVANYLALEKLRFKELMNYSINVDDDVDTLDIMVPPLFIQPLVENSIKHGVLPRQSEDSNILLNVYEKGDILVIEVKDNGVGLTKSKQNANVLHESFGLKNIQDRVEQLSMILGKKIEFTMEERMEDTGQWTVVTIKMHL
ncbi:MAG: histidine kinase, partial [Taibaiella sp.]|nr:histidine kinase [Taibaiella sp.]